MSPKYQRLAGKHVLVIGGTSGIGFCVAEASASAGANVTVSSSRESNVKNAIVALKTDYPSSKVNGHVCDLSKSSLERDVEKLFEQTGKVDHIVFTAGDSLADLPVQEITLEKAIQAGQVRFFAPLLVAKVGSKFLNSGPNSSIVFTTGTASERPIPNWSVVASYAAGLHGMIRNLAIDLAPVRVNLVNPGLVNTSLLNFMKDAEKQEFFKGAAAKFPTGVVAKPEDVAEVYLWLMKDRNVTGTVANSDSGSLLV